MKSRLYDVSTLQAFLISRRRSLVPKIPHHNFSSMYIGLILISVTEETNDNPASDEEETVSYDFFSLHLLHSIIPVCMSPMKNLVRRKSAG